MNDSGFYPGFQHRLSVFYSVEIGYSASKINMSTCRSVQADSYESICRSVQVFIFFHKTQFYVLPFFTTLEIEDN